MVPITVEKAVEILDRSHLAAALFTTPRHTDDAPRWRVFVPTTKEYAPEHHKLFVGRLNAIFDDCLDGASFRTSQGFYFGGITGKPARVELVEGHYIDQSEIKPYYKKLPRAERVGGGSTGAKVDDLPLEELRRITLELDNRGSDFAARGDWLEILCAIHHQTDGSEEGRELAHEWSAQYPLYNVQKTDDTWDTLSGDGITARTILWIAKEKYGVKA